MGLRTQPRPPSAKVGFSGGRQWGAVPITPVPSGSGAGGAGGAAPQCVASRAGSDGLNTQHSDSSSYSMAVSRR